SSGSYISRVFPCLLLTRVSPLNTYTRTPILWLSDEECNEYPPPMKSGQHAGDQLRWIARRAMLERGLLPDFSPAVLSETNAVVGAAEEVRTSVRDLRSLLWVSIDNDDSRDLDQLSVAVPIAAGGVKILVAVADVDAIVKKGSAIDGHAWTNTTSIYTAAG